MVHRARDHRHNILPLLLVRSDGSLSFHCLECLRPAQPAAGYWRHYHRSSYRAVRPSR